MMEYLYTLTMKVRDYECDLQGIVNNANYQHYTEHTRHEFLRTRGVSFADLHARGIDAVVARMHLSLNAPYGVETALNLVWLCARKVLNMYLCRTSTECPTISPC